MSEANLLSGGDGIQGELSYVMDYTQRPVFSWILHEMAWVCYNKKVHYDIITYC